MSRLNTSPGLYLHFESVALANGTNTIQEGVVEMFNSKVERVIVAVAVAEITKQGVLDPIHTIERRRHNDSPCHSTTDSGNTLH